MHKAYAKDGVVVISLSLDDKEDKDKALDFLKKQEAAFQNFLLDDTDANKEKWEKDFAFSAPPITHVYGRDGKKVKSFEGKKECEGVEPLVKELIGKK